ISFDGTSRERMGRTRSKKFETVVYNNEKLLEIHQIISRQVVPSDEICVEEGTKPLIYKIKSDDGLVFLKDSVPLITEIKKNIPAKYFSPSVK
ncbi:34271_t:CDS:2, partial [Racocetra persica]